MCFETVRMAVNGGHPRSLISVPIESAYIYATSYWSSIVTLVLYFPVSEIFSGFLLRTATPPLFHPNFGVTQCIKHLLLVRIRSAFAVCTSRIQNWSIGVLQRSLRLSDFVTTGLDITKQTLVNCMFILPAVNRNIIHYLSKISQQPTTTFNYSYVHINTEVSHRTISSCETVDSRQRKRTRSSE